MSQQSKVVFSENTTNGSEMRRFLFMVGNSHDFQKQYLAESEWTLLANDSGLSLFWKNEEKLSLCTYCEGDVVFIKAPTQEAFENDLSEFTSWYADQGCLIGQAINYLTHRGSSLWG